MKKTFSLFDHIFYNIDLFDNLDEIIQWSIAELNRRHINAIAEYRTDLGYDPPTKEIDDEDYIDADEWVNSRHFLRCLVTDKRCPRWLEKNIVWHILKDNKYW